MVRYFVHGLIVFCTLILQANCYERCSLFRYCQTGSCCKIKFEWYCTGSIYSLSDCESFAEKTTNRPSTTTETTVSVNEKNEKYGITILAVSVGGGGVLFISLIVLVLCIFKQRRPQGQYLPSRVPMTNAIQGQYGIQHISSISGMTMNIPEGYVDVTNNTDFIQSTDFINNPEISLLKHQQA